MQLEDWLDDLCVRFIINLPPEELASVERICFQVEEAQWFYEDFIRPLDPSLPSLSLKQFSLAIFQHCPLFAQWSAQHHTTAFAEFLAYKQRVPVRGAIMLNDAMDEVVLVKGWKKGANWSFPRGKINKDENDLDCAVREVYEETGFDIQAAGLVKPEKEMKYIEVTMREQHMRLYVFRGVPKSTHFEPRTRKEISKIQWYKLTDLPILKKKTHHEGAEESNAAAVNANKFYMVAPFLHPLKKWIAQQRKKEGRNSSSLAVPSVLAEESATESEMIPVPIQSHTRIYHQPMSSLPEVLVPQDVAQPMDASTHLKELLNIGGHSQAVSSIPQPVTAQDADATRSNALLSLLRNGTASNTSANLVQVPSNQYQYSFPPSHLSAPAYQDQLPHSVPQPQHAIVAGQHADRNKQNLLQLFGQASMLSSSTPPERAGAQRQAPYQQTGDLSFSRDSPEASRNAAIPAATALPKLTHHTKALLDAFTVGQPVPSPVPALPVAPIQLAPSRQALLDAFKSPGPLNSTNANALPLRQSELPTKTVSQVAIAPSAPAVGELSSQSPAIQPSLKANLVDLFKRPTVPSTKSVATEPQTQPTAPVELSAAPVEPQSGPSQSEILAALFKKGKNEQIPQRQRSPIAKVGQTSATITAPINQPQFEAITRNVPSVDTPVRRSPAPPNRTLFNPKQSTPVKILARPESSSRQPPRSPRGQKVQVQVSSPKWQAKLQEKQFQPQILRRPQGSETLQRVSPSPSLPPPVDAARASHSPSNITKASPTPNLDAAPSISPIPIAATGPVIASRRPSEQADPHKQNLLSLFSSPSPSIPPSVTPLPLPTQNSTLPPIKPISTAPTSGIMSPITHSQIVSPIDEPISTRSRVGSIASIASPSLGPLGMNAHLNSSQTSMGVGDGRFQKGEKRQTPAGDKAFLLGYLGRFANQDG